MSVNSGSLKEVQEMESIRNLFGLAVLVVFCLCVAYGEVPAAPVGLVSHWRFDEGGGDVAYDSAGGNDGVVYGADWADGVLDGALEFDGVDDCVGLPDNSPVWLPEYDFACSAWVYFDAPAASVSGSEILLDLNWTASNSPTNDNGCIVLRKDSGEVFFGMTTITDVDEKLYSNHIFTEGEWHHIVALRGGTNQAMYVNGNLDSSRTCSASQIDYSGGSYDDDGVSIGRITTASDPNGIFFLDGKMDDVRIYDVALTAEEIVGLYEAVPEPHEAQVYHVDGAGGSDFNDGLSRATAFATIQKGIDSSLDRGEVVVWPGVYTEEVRFKGKAITVRSAGDAATIENPGDFAVSFYYGEGPGSVLKNFIVANSLTGIFIAGSSPTISNVTVVNNILGIEAYAGSEPDISSAILWDNIESDIYGCEAAHSWVQSDFGPAAPTDGLVAHWKFDEGEGSIAYDSAGSNDGVVYGADWVDGVLDGALDFDGVDDGVALPDNSPVWLPEYDFTCSVWVYFDTPASAGRHETLLDLNATSSSNPINDIGCAVKRIDDGTVGFGFNTIPGVTHALYSNQILTEGEWYHIVTLRDGTIQAIYVNGNLDNSGICSADQMDYEGGSYDDDGVNIGRVTTTNSPNGAQHIDGKMDDVRIYDRGLSAGEVELLYGGGLAGQDDVDTLKPLFAGAGDYHLVSERGRYWPAHDVWVLDKVSSPCIDAGDPAIEPSGEPMPNGGAINMGAYGGTGYASMSEWPFAYDGNRDGRLDFKDLAGLCDEWLLSLPWAQ